MGVHGFKKWLDNYNVTRVSKNSTDAFHHVLIDMNCLVHSSYDRRDPTVSGTRSRLFMMLDKLYARFPAKISLSVIFDGAAPIAKLATQRTRRRGYCDVEQQHTQDTLNEGEITTGSTFMLETEKLVEAHLLKRLESGSLAAKQVIFSGTRVAGEGEAKISEILLQLSRRAADETCDDPGYHPDECICIIGNDSDLVVHCIAAVSYHNLFVAHPVSFVLTSVGDLLLGWLHGNSAALTLAQLPSARLDFCFLTQLAGCDHYEGIDDNAWSAWHTYRGARCKPNRFSSRLVTFMHGPEKGDPRLVVNTAFLRDVLAPDVKFAAHKKGGGKGSMGGSKWNKARREFDRQQKNRKKSNPEGGTGLVEAALWSLGSSCFGVCSDYTYRWKGSAATMPSLVSATRSTNLSKIAAPRGEALPPLAPLQLYVAITAKPKLLPNAVQQLLDTDPVLKRLTQYDSITSVLTAVSTIFEQIAPQSGALSSSERELMRFTHPRKHIRRSNGVVTIDPFTPETLSEGFATFQYSLDTLTNGIRMAALQEKDYCATIKLSAKQLAAFVEASARPAPATNEVLDGGGNEGDDASDNEDDDDADGDDNEG